MGSAMEERPAAAPLTPVLVGAALVGVVVSAGILYLVYGRTAASGGSGEGPSSSLLPALNAAFNGASALFLLAGRLAIGRGRERLHRALMLGALGASALFLAGYLTHHALHGDTPYPAGAPWRPAYLALLATHVLGSIVVLPGVLATVFLAATGRRRAHRKVARLTWPLWLWVSVSGVAIFLALRAAGA